MEILLALQPIGDCLIHVCLWPIVFLGIAAVILHINSVFYKDDQHWTSRDGVKTMPEHVINDRTRIGSNLRNISKKLYIIVLICTILLIPSIVISQGWNIFKNVIIYRVVTSETADKTIENTNLFMDKMNQFIDEWDPKKTVDQVEEKVKETVKEATK